MQQPQHGDLDAVALPYGRDQIVRFRPPRQLQRHRRQHAEHLPVVDQDNAREPTGLHTARLSIIPAGVHRWKLQPSRNIRDRAAQVFTRDSYKPSVRENIRRDLIEQGLNDSIAVQVTNSKDNPDIFGKPNVYRVIVGGTIEQSGIPTIGIAQDDIHNLICRRCQLR